MVPLMDSGFEPHLQIALRHAVPGVAETSIPRLELRIGRAQADATPCLYRSMVCFVLQGAKEVAIGDNILYYDEMSYLVSAVEIPLMGRLLDCGPNKPYVSVALTLDHATLVELAMSMRLAHAVDKVDTGVAINTVTPQVRDALHRLLQLLDNPTEISVLAPLIERELLYRLLQDPQAHLMRQIAQPEGAVARIRRAIAWIRDNYNRQLCIQALCEASSMSRASLHRHFRATTGFSPIQYQKQLRLQEARRLLHGYQHTAARVAFTVGYESETQFSREYARRFGKPPMRDIARLKASSRDMPSRSS